MTARGDKALARGVLALAAMMLILPIVASLALTFAAAFGHLPALGAYGPNLSAWSALLGTAGVGRAVMHSVMTGTGAAVLSLALALALAAVFGARPFLARILTPLLAIPHAAMAIGLAFLLAPSGWIARLAAPAFGWTAPPDLASIGDPFGIALILGLAVKEVPFLLLMILSAQRQIPLAQIMATGAALGYGRAAIWAKVIAPMIWPQIRLPFLVVLVFGLSVIDMAMILGPSNPPTLAVLLTRLYASPDVTALLPASAGAALILLVSVAVAVAAMAGVAGVGAIVRLWLRAGGRGAALDGALWALAVLAAGLLVLGVAAMVVLGLWSLSWRWPWPLLLPQSISLAAWGNVAGWAGPLVNTIIIGTASTALALLLAIAWLEGEDRGQSPRAPWAEAMIYLPLMVPQIAFLFGMNVLALRLGANGTLWPVVWAHGLFVFPYVMIALTGPWRALDQRLIRTAQSLGAGPWRILLAVKLPILLAPLLAAVAIGTAVSVAQYLPTLFLGAGRISTLTTEAVTLAASSDRRVTAVVSAMQALVPLLAFGCAVILPVYVHRNRRALSGKVAP